MNNKMEKNMTGSGRGLVLRYFPGIYLEGLKKYTKILNQDERPLDRHVNPGLPQYEAGMLNTRPSRLVAAHYRYSPSSYLLYVRQLSDSPNWGSKGRDP
jgi:hypothetical protein